VKVKELEEFLSRIEVQDWIVEALEFQHVISQQQLRNEKPGSVVHDIRRRQCQEIHSIINQFQDLMS
jgi:hypothetical protein